MTGHGDVPLAVQAIKAGALDFIEKPFYDEVILASIERAATRESRQARGRTGAADDVIGQHIARLTPRELEVFQQLILGHPNKVIAYHLNISARTVEIHRARVMGEDGGAQPTRAGPHGDRGRRGDAGIGARNRPC